MLAFSRGGVAGGAATEAGTGSHSVSAGGRSADSVTDSVMACQSPQAVSCCGSVCNGVAGRCQVWGGWEEGVSVGHISVCVCVSKCGVCVCMTREKVAGSVTDSVVCVSLSVGV